MGWRLAGHLGAEGLLGAAERLRKVRVLLLRLRTGLGARRGGAGGGMGTHHVRGGGGGGAAGGGGDLPSCAGG